MGAWILLIIAGLICILLPRTQWHKDYIKNHNFSALDEFFTIFRNIVGWFCIFLGSIAFANMWF